MRIADASVVAPLRGLAGDERRPAGSRLREPARVGTDVARRRRTGARARPERRPRSSTISNAAVFCPSMRYGLSELTRTCVPRSASARAAASASSKLPRTWTTRAPSAPACATFAAATAPWGWRTTARSPARAAYAAADAAVFPVEAQITVETPASSAFEIASVIPRSLKLPVGFAPSHLRYSSTPSRSDRRGAEGAASSPLRATRPASTSSTGRRSRYRSMTPGTATGSCHAQPSSTTPRSEITGKSDGAAWIDGQLGDLRERGLDLALRRLVEDDVERRARADGHLREPRDRDAVRGEPVRRPRRGRRDGRRPRGGDRTGERRSPGGMRSSVRQHGSSWRKPVPVVPMIETRSATTADAVSIPPAPGPSSVISRIASPWSITPLNAPSIAASGWWRSTSAGRTRTSTWSSMSVAAPTSRTTISSSRAAAEDRVGGPRARGSPTSAKRDPRAERDRREDRHLRGRVRAGDVVRRIGLGEPAPLRLGERVRVRRAALHLGEDEVRRPVHDPEDAVHVRRDERLAEHLDHRDRPAHARLEAELDTGRDGRREELGSALRDELLVRGHDRLAGARAARGRATPAGSRPPITSATTADRRVVANRVEVRREHAVPGVEAALAREIADERAHDAQPVPGRALDVVRVLDEQSVDRGADRPVAEEADADLGS